MSESTEVVKNPKRRRWLRCLLRLMAWIIVIVIAVPVALYIPPVQEFVKNIACDVVKKKTGMEIKVKRLRLKFPLDIDLQGVAVVPEKGDTMVKAEHAIVALKLMPLFRLDVVTKQLALLDGYYKMVSPDSSMVMKIRAGKLLASAGSSADIRNATINLGDVSLKDGSLELYMNVWKKKPTPEDTTSVPFKIKAKRLELENFQLGMSMLPTIDTLELKTNHLVLERGNVDLATNIITASVLDIKGGGFKYIAPTAEYVKLHPAPVDTTNAASPPMLIKAGEIAIRDFAGLYATKGAKPQAGFDPAYMEFVGIEILLENFYNRSSELVLPIKKLKAKERCGLTVTEGEGTISLDSMGLELRRVSLKTPFSAIKVNAGLPFALMELQPRASLNAKADITLGWPDIDCLMPSLQKITRNIPGRKPLYLIAEATGTVQNVEVPELKAGIPGVVGIKASGYAMNALDITRLKGRLQFSGELLQPSIIDKLAGPIGVVVPKLKLNGVAEANNQTYRANIKAFTSDGDLGANGEVALTTEGYKADVEVNEFNLSPYLAGYGLGCVTASANAEGKGFNPLNPGALTKFKLDVKSIEYKGARRGPVYADGRLEDSHLWIECGSLDRDADFLLSGDGEIHDGNYKLNAVMDITNLNLMGLGLDSTYNRGYGHIYVQADATPAQWLYDVNLNLRNVNWQLGEETISLPQGATVHFCSDETQTDASIESLKTDLNFKGYAPLNTFINSFDEISGCVRKQISRRSLDVDTLACLLPSFNLTGHASGNGLLEYFLSPSGLAIDSLSINLGKDSKLYGDISVLGATNNQLTADTLNLSLQQRGKELDYKLSMGNRPGVMDEFAQVSISGFLGDNKLKAVLAQKNIKGEVGYNIGVEADVEDKTINLHFTPQDATIAYLPWQINKDNFLSYNLRNLTLKADLEAESKLSKILIRTEPTGDEQTDKLHLVLDNIQIQDFLNMSVFAPPVTASLNTDLNVVYTGKVLMGGGNASVKNLTYEGHKVGDFDVDLGAGMDMQGNSRARIALKIDEKPALALRAMLKSTSEGLKPDSIGLELTEFPLRVANAFIGADVAQLGGTINGKFDMKGSFTEPLLNGNLTFSDASAYVAMIGSKLTMPDNKIEVLDNVLKFKDFNIYAANKNPLTLKGEVNARKFSNPNFNLAVIANNFQLVGNTAKAKSDLYGNLFLTMNAIAQGNLQVMNIEGNVSVLSATDVTYTIPEASNVITQSQNDGVVKFVNFSDTTKVAKADTVPSSIAMRINASLTLQPGMQATVMLSGNGTDKVQLQPSGTLTLFQNYMGDMRLNGQIQLGTGFARYTIPVIGQKSFDFNPESYVAWNGAVMNPSFNITGYDQVRASVQQSGGNSRLVDFLITLYLSGNLDNPQVKFDLATDSDVSIQNELSTMSADQRQTQAMNMLIYGQYIGPGSKSLTGPLTGNLYGFLASQVNQWAAKNIRGVDLSFGVDQYDNRRDGTNGTTTSYSYQVSKSLFNNRFKVSVGGNYDTDSSNDEIADNLFSDVSVEYILRQTASSTMLVKLFRHADFENILEGEIIETGAGFVYRRRMGDLRHLFRFGKRKNKGKTNKGEGEESSDKTDSLENNILKKNSK